MELMKEQRCYLKLFVDTSPGQRKVLLTSITKPQLRALSQIAHNVIKNVLRLTSDEKKPLKRYRRLFYVLKDTRESFATKRRAIADKPKLIYRLIKAALNYLEPELWKK